MANTVVDDYVEVPVASSEEETPYESTPPAEVYLIREDAREEISYIFSYMGLVRQSEGSYRQRDTIEDYLDRQRQIIQKYEYLITSLEAQKLECAKKLEDQEQDLLRYYWQLEQYLARQVYRAYRYENAKSASTDQEPYKANDLSKITIANAPGLAGIRAAGTYGGILQSVQRRDAMSAPGLYLPLIGRQGSLLPGLLK